MPDRRAHALVFSDPRNPATKATEEKLSMLSIEHKVRPLSEGRTFARIHKLKLAPMVVFWTKDGKRHAWEGHQPKLIERYAGR